MTPTKIGSAHYFVHIGYDENEQPELETRLREHIDFMAKYVSEDVKNQVEHILVFCDLPVLSEKEAELVTVWSLAETIAQFFATQQIYSMMAGVPELLKHADTILMERYPACIVKDLYEMFDGKWQLMRRPSQALEDFKKENRIIPTEEEDAIIRKDCKEIDRTYITAVTEEFLPALRKLSGKYSKKNPYGLSIKSPSNPYAVPKNFKRRDRIESHAVDTLGEKRIFLYELPDGENQKRSIERDERFKEYRSGWRDIEIFEETFWNATPYVEDIISKIDRMKFHRYRKDLLGSVKDRGFSFTRSTAHFVAGEYWMRCVSNMKDHLLDHFKYAKKQIFPYSRSCLVKDRDDLMDNLGYARERAVLRNDWGLILPAGLSWEDIPEKIEE